MTGRGALALAATGLLIVAGCGSSEPAPASPGPAQRTPAATQPVEAPRVPGLAVYESRYDVAETSERVQDGLREAGMVVAVVDHAQIDLPTRFLARQDSAGAVHVGHPDIRALAQRHGITTAGDTLTMIGNATAMFTGIAAGAPR